MLSLGLEHQPDEFLTVQFTDGETKDLGSFIVGLGGGAAFSLTPDHKYELQGVLGVRFSSIEASNGDLDFRDFPLELTGHVNLGNVRLGLGPTLHLGGKLSGSGDASALDVEFDTALGALGVVEYRAQKFGLGLRYSWLDLDAKTGGSIDASSFGALFSLYL
jgi:hypothetical protein